MNKIRPPKLKKIEKLELGLFSIPKFRLNFEIEGVEIYGILTVCSIRIEKILPSVYVQPYTSRRAVLGPRAVFS